MKDHFYREIKVIHEGSAKKRKYVYFDDMEFMRPFVGLKLQTLPKVEKNDSLDESSNLVEDTTQDEFSKMNDDTDYVMEELLKSNDSNNEEEYKPTHMPLRRPSQRQMKPTAKAMARKTLPANSKVTKDQKVIVKNFEGVKKTNVHPASSTTAAGSSGSGAGTLPSFKIRDGDISFCLSLVPTFRKLGDSSKLRAKIEVLKILHKFVEHVERNKPTTNANTSRLEDAQFDEQDIIQEDHLDDGDVDEVINVKHEQHDDPLNSAGGNTKAWWT